MTCSLTDLHPFEKAGLGKAPFRYVGLEYQDIAHGQRVLGSAGGCEVTTRPGGTCAFCGQYILNMFQVESADGQRFHVGCDCIFKVRDPGLTSAVNADKRVMKRDRDAARIEAARAALPTAYGLRGQRHPTPYRADNGATMADYCRWLLDNAGTAGKLRAARIIEAAMAPIADD